MKTVIMKQDRVVEGVPRKVGERVDTFMADVLVAGGRAEFFDAAETETTKGDNGPEDQAETTGETEPEA